MVVEVAVVELHERLQRELDAVRLALVSLIAAVPDEQSDPWKPSWRRSPRGPTRLGQRWTSCGSPGKRAVSRSERR